MSGKRPREQSTPSQAKNTSNCGAPFRRSSLPLLIVSRRARRWLLPRLCWLFVAVLQILAGGCQKKSKIYREYIYTIDRPVHPRAPTSVTHHPSSISASTTTIFRSHLPRFICYPISYLYSRFLSTSAYSQKPSASSN